MSEKNSKMCKIYDTQKPNFKIKLPILIEFDLVDMTKLWTKLFIHKNSSQSPYFVFQVPLPPPEKWGCTFATFWALLHFYVELFENWACMNTPRTRDTAPLL